MTSTDAAAATAHPLDPLAAGELEQAVALLRDSGAAGDGVRVISVDLLEPDKAALATWHDGGAEPPREALAVLYDTRANLACEHTVDLGAGRISDRRSLEGMQPAISMDEFVEAGRACREHPEFLEALARRGIEGDLIELVYIEPWTVGSFERSDLRLARCLAWMRSSHDDVNPYGRPLGGLLAVVDLAKMRVVRIDDHGPLPVPDGNWDYRDGGGAGFRDDQRPIEITQPEGTSFTLDGRELRWQSWRLRVGFSHRESLVLNEIGYEQDGQLRPICHRASIAELVIPYGDPNPTVHFKNVFDIGEYGVGPLVNPLELGCDCLGDIRYLDAACVDSRGEALTLPNAICIHEEDYGILWKHRDDTTGRTDVAAPRRLVISCITTVGNYEYGFYWYLYQDGGIEFEGKLTGIVLTAGVRPGAAARTRPRSRRVWPRATTSTSSPPGWTWMLTGQATLPTRSSRCPMPTQLGEPTARRSRRRGAPSPASPRQCATWRQWQRGAGGWRTRAAGTGWATRWPTSWCRARMWRRWRSRGRSSAGGRASSTTTCG